jgi:hypothetical protein
MWRSFDILVDGLEQEAEAEEEEEQDADDQDVSSEGDVPKLSWTEVYLIMHETLEGFFATELERVVLIPLHLLYSC